MKSIKYLLMLTVAIMFTMSSCTKENSIIDEVTPPVVDPTESSSNPLVGRAVTTEEGLDMGCFSIDYPFSLSINGTEVAITNEDDFMNAIEIDSTTISDDFYIDFVYPLGITYYEDGATASVADGEALGEAFAVCIPDGGWVEPGFPVFLINDLNSCFELVYPVDMIDFEGATYTAANEDEFINLVAEHPELSFVFPISMTEIESQDVVTAEDEDNLFELLISCEDSWTPPVDTICNPGIGEFYFACYEVGFPLNYYDFDGNTQTATDLDALYEALFSGSGFSDFALPLTLIDEEGVELVVTTEEEIETALTACGYTTPGGNPDLEFLWFTAQDPNGCYSLVYPITVSSDDGNIVTTTILNNEEELLVEMGNDIASTIVFPLIVLDNASNENVTFESMDDLFTFFADCQ